MTESLTLDDKIKIGKPYCRLEEFRRPDGFVVVRLMLSVSLVVKHGIRPGEKVDIYYKHHEDTWQCPVLIVKRDGTQRSLYRRVKSSPKLVVNVKKLFTQHQIAVMHQPLEVLDYLELEDGDEIVLDYSGKVYLPPGREKYWSSRFGRLKRVSPTLRGTKFTVSANTRFIDLMKSVATAEAKKLSPWILDVVSAYIEDNYLQLWEEWTVEVVRRESENVCRNCGAELSANPKGRGLRFLCPECPK